MRDENSIVRDRQLAMRREIDRRGISLKAVAFDSGIPYATLISYMPNQKHAVPHMMPISALCLLIKALPLDIVSLLLPDSHAIMSVPEGVDHDELARACADYQNTYTAARHPKSECGVDIGPGEKSSLDGKGLAVMAVAA